MKYSRFQLEYRIRVSVPFNFRWTLVHPFNNLIILEPIGGAAPKFSSESKTIGTFEKTGGDSLALACPAQAYPLPTFRYKTVKNFRVLIEIEHYKISSKIFFNILHLLVLCLLSTLK